MGTQNISGFYKPLGELLKALRLSKELKQVQVAHRVYDYFVDLGYSQPYCDKFCDRWVRAVEAGERELSREVLEAYCCALDCTQPERIKVFVYADRNPFIDTNSPMTEESIQALQVMCKAISISPALCKAIIDSSKGLAVSELGLLIATAFRLVMDGDDGKSKDNSKRK